MVSMFPLSTKTFPSSATELARLLNESLGQLFADAADPVVLHAEAYPEIKELRISLDGATLRANLPRPPAARDAASPALTLESLTIHGAGITLGPATVDLNLSARGVRLSQSRATNDEIVLLLQSAVDGRVEISSAKAALEQAIAAVAKTEAGKHGVTIDQVHLTLSPRGDRGLTGEVQLRARKLFLSTVIRIAGEFDLDAQLNASVTNLHCHGEGAMASLACGFLEPHLQKLNGRSLSLVALPLGEIRLCDVRLTANERLTVTAEFAA